MRVKVSGRGWKGALFFFLLLVLPWFAGNEYWMNILILSGVYILMAQGLNVIIGLSGQFVCCQATFAGFGAYLSALAVIRLGIPFWGAFLLAGILSALLGGALGFICNRFRGHYVALVTVSFAIIFYEVALQWVALTGGAMGLLNIPPPPALSLGSLTVDFNNRLSFYYLILLLLVLCLYSVRRVIDSRIGDALLSIREDDRVAEIMGVNVDRYKIKAFIFGAFWAGVSGSFYAHYAGIFVPQDFSLFISVLILAFVILGGMGSLWGVCLSTVLLMFFPEWLRFVEYLRWVIYGVILMVGTIYLPRGLAGLAARRRESGT